MNAGVDGLGAGLQGTNGIYSSKGCRIVLGCNLGLSHLRQADPFAFLCLSDQDSDFLGWSTI